MRLLYSFDVTVLLDSEWNSSAVDLFEELSHTAKWKSVMARIVGSRQTSYGVTIPCVQLVDTNGSTVCFSSLAALDITCIFGYLCLNKSVGQVILYCCI